MEIRRQKTEDRRQQKEKNTTFASRNGLVAQWIEQQPSKLWAPRSNRGEITEKIKVTI